MIKNSEEFIEKNRILFESSLRFQIDFQSNYFSNNFSQNNIDSKCISNWRKKFDSGWHALLFEKNVKAAQQHFYICGRMDEYMVGILGHRTDLRHLRSTLFNVSNVIHWFTAFLSGNEALIKRRWELR